MNHDSSQLNCISGVIGGSVTMTENHAECKYSRSRVITNGKEKELLRDKINCGINNNKQTALGGTDSSY